MNTSTQRLQAMIPLLQQAIRTANNDGRAQLGILSTKYDSSGKVVCRWDCEQFVNDICDVIGAPQLLTVPDPVPSKTTRFLKKLKFWE